MSEIVSHFYCSRLNAFYSSEFPEVINDEGLTKDDLTIISEEDFNLFFNPPEGKYGAWIDGKPVLLDIPAPDYQALAESKRKVLLDEATQAIAVWQTKMLMGRKLTDAETKSLNAWMDYIDALNDTDISDAPNVKRPAKPA